MFNKWYLLLTLACLGFRTCSSVLLLEYLPDSDSFNRLTLYLLPGWSGLPSSICSDNVLQDMPHVSGPCLIIPDPSSFQFDCSANVNRRDHINGSMARHSLGINIFSASTDRQSCGGHSPDFRNSQISMRGR